ncbi:MAG: hypothetical protein IT170_03965, partial [Bryobacterales bacterium]|nr:hypothetical protein [Bryobacterales bacterium]
MLRARRLSIPVLTVSLSLFLAMTPGFGATPYFSDPFLVSPFSCSPTTPVPPQSGLNGAMIYTHPDCPEASETSEGVTPTSANGASWIRLQAPPTGNEHETKIRFVLGSTSGTKLVYVGATSNAWWKDAYNTQGTGYAVSMTTYPGYYGEIQANIKIRRLQYGYSVDLASFNATVTSAPVLRVARTNLSGTWKILLHIDDVYVGSVIDSTYTSGSRYPGFGMKDSPVAAYVDEVWHYAIEHGAPDYNTLNSSLLTGSSPNQILFQWNPTTDTAGGSSYGASGMSRYELYRDGALRVTVKHQAQTMFFADTGLNPGQTYNYTLRAIDFHGNATDVTRSITTPLTSPTVSSTLPRRIGVSSLGSTWGAGGENIDLLSGNLNVALPVLSALGRGGYAVPLALHYNSQNWMESSGVGAHYGRYQGAGYGWRLQFGAIRPVLLGSNLSHYVYEDPTGTEYPLDIVSGTLWRSSQFAPVLEYDAATNRLWFKDGSFWQMDCVAASGEPDSNSRYPTLMQDTNGNQIYVRYLAGKNASWANSSARISEIEDVRAVDLGSTRRTYRFEYVAEQGYPSLPPRLYRIVLESGLTTEITTFTHSAVFTLKSPFTGVSTGVSARLLTGITVSAGGSTSFQYGAGDSGELTRMTFPYGGTIDYTHATATYSSKKIRAVTARALTPTAGGATYTYSFVRSGAGDIPASTQVIDASNASDKVWSFDTNPTSMYFGLWTQLDERERPSLSVKRRQAPAYDFHAPAKVFVKSVDTTMDPGTANAITARAGQWLDGYGNLVSSYGYQYTDLVNPAREMRFTYAHTLAGGEYGFYAANRLLNRLQKVELKNGANWIPLKQTTYGNALAVGSGCSPYLKNFATGTHCVGGPLRANAASVTAMGQTVNFEYDITGNTQRTWGAAPEVAESFGSGTNFTLPEVITPNNTPSLATSFSYNADFRATQTVAPNNAASQASYDAFGRVATSTSAAGAVTAYTYGIDTGTRIDTVRVYPQSDASAFTFSRTTMDGLGRPVKSESGGSDGAVKTVTETEYEPCACSPTGKRKRVSLPYAPGGTVQWTTYSYDALGRTLSVALPNGSGVTSYEYVKNTVKVADAAGKWKKYETNGLGELVKVTEPNPAGGADLETLYSYNLLGQMTTATMTRGGATQVRSFVYDLATGRLTSETKPETGTASYAYNSDGTLLSSTDAKLQKTELAYDSLKRVTSVKRFIYSGGVLVEQPCQEVSFTYDAGAGANLAGRLAKATAKQCDANVTEYNEVYSYEASGLLQYRDANWVRNGATLTRRVDPTWNQMGAMTGFGYGTSGSLYSFAYTFDNAWRPVGMTGEGLTLVSGVSYNAAGAMTGFTRDDGSGTPVNNVYGFNALYQMTNQTV